jgi:chromate transporter
MSQPSADPPPAAPSGATPSVLPVASLPALFWIFFQIGAMSFGGGLAAWIHREIVLKRGWMTEIDFHTGLALSQVLPGVNNVNMAVHVGQRLRGVVGSLTCVFAMLLAPFFMIIGLATIYEWIKDIAWMQDMLDGVAAAAVGLLVSVAARSARGTFRGIPPFAIAIAFIVTIGILRWPMVPVVLVLAPLSVLLVWLTRGRGLLGGRDA